MKQLLSIFFCIVAPFACFAPGIVRFGNGTNNYFVLGRTYLADAALGGGSSSIANNTATNAPGAIPISPLPSGVTLNAVLYAGSAENLARQVVVPLTATNWLRAGRMIDRTLTIPGFSGGSLLDFAVVVTDGDPPSTYTAEGVPTALYYGTSGLFQCVLGTPPATPPTIVGGGTSTSTWPFENLVVNAQNIPPTIVLPPTPAIWNTAVGSSATFSAAARGYSPSYQWYFGADQIPDATNSPLHLTNLHIWQSGAYSLVATNIFGSVTSAPAILNVLTSLGIDMIPAITLTAEVGYNYSLQFITAASPTNGWNSIVTITITNNPQTFLDWSALGEPRRFYRLVQVP
jgi:hypothetical protein